MAIFSSSSKSTPEPTKKTGTSAKSTKKTSKVTSTKTISAKAASTKSATKKSENVSSSSSGSGSGSSSGESGNTSQESSSPRPAATTVTRTTPAAVSGGVSKVTGSGGTGQQSRIYNPCDRARVIRLPPQCRPQGGGCCPPQPPPWCRPPPPPWGCCPPPPCGYPCGPPPPPYGCCFPPPPPCAPPPCFPPPFSPVCNYPPSGGCGKQVIRVPRGCPPPCLPGMPPGGCGAAQPACYNNCNFYTMGGPPSEQQNGCSGGQTPPPPFMPPFLQGMMPPGVCGPLNRMMMGGGGMGDARGLPGFPGSGVSSGLGLNSSSEDFFSDLDVLAAVPSCNVTHMTPSQNKSSPAATEILSSKRTSMATKTKTKKESSSSEESSSGSGSTESSDSSKIKVVTGAGGVSKSTVKKLSTSGSSS